MDAFLVRQLVLAAPAGQGRLAVHPQRGLLPQFAIFGQPLVPPGSLLRLFRGQPFAIDPDLPQLPVCRRVLGRLAQGPSKILGTAAVVAGGLVFQCGLDQVLDRRIDLGRLFAGSADQAGQAGSATATNATPNRRITKEDCRIGSSFSPFRFRKMCPPIRTNGPV